MSQPFPSVHSPQLLISLLSVPNYRILTLKPFLENPPLGRYIPFTQLTASVSSLNLHSALWINVYRWPWVRAHFLDFPLIFTFPSPSMVDGPQSRDPVTRFRIHLQPTLEMSVACTDADERRTRRGRRQSQQKLESLPWPRAALLIHVRPSYKVDWAKEREQIRVYVYFHRHKNNWSKVNVIFKTQWKTYLSVPSSVTLDGVCDLYIKVWSERSFDHY